jgi:hypothetical protein
MTTHAATRTSRKPNLDNLTLSRKEGWRDIVEATPPTRPEAMPIRQLRRLSDSAITAYNARRSDWHANIRVKTPQLEALHEDLWDILDSSMQHGDRAKGAIAIDGYPGLGKTTAVQAFAEQFHRREISRHGPMTQAGDERWPVCRVGLRGNTSMKDFNRAVCDFFAHPGQNRGTTTQLADHALDCVLSCEVKLLIIDDLHFLHWQRNGGVEISNHFKFVANEFPLTLLSIGIGLGERGLLREGVTPAELAQTTRRTTMLAMAPFNVDTDRERRQWRRFLMTIEEHLVLARKHPGMLAGDLSDYLFIRSNGYIGSLMTLIERGCQRAIRRGTEVLTKELLDTVPIDSAAELARRELEAAFRTRKKTTQLQLQ